ncbi:SprT-like family-domain-containing protein [Fusarium flagelliforme]|uniref:Hmg box-containing protein c19g7.04 n=1 Tax=Fusarium flagelliforme TaxID=2675880 RepID=A0A395MW97_9HYPO|nr:SprT-like family-domain-containing protein [Fusarium flagelliforme]KAH7192539.1 SprT-like family-domain-containing protein [Fusarium flagelliforme]RFN52010.1 hmg box-containing protein c19g7.04 [Fusarium flagelliforme]
MARLAGACFSSDDDLPDLKTLLQKPSTRATKKTTKSAPSTTAARAPKATANSESRRVRRLGEPNQVTANPLFQKWNSEQEENVRERGSKARAKSSTRSSRETTPGSQTEMKPVSESEDDDFIPQARKQPSRRRNRRIVEDSDDSDGGSDESSNSEKETVLTRVRRLQKAKTSTITMPSTDAKKQTSKIDLTKSKALLFAREIDSEIDSGTDTEVNHEEEQADEPSVYQTADEISDSVSEPDWLNESPDVPVRKGTRQVNNPLPRTTGTRDRVPSIKNVPALVPKASGCATDANSITRDITKKPASDKDVTASRKTSRGTRQGVPGTSTASDLADTLSKLRLQLEDFSDEDSKLSSKDQFTTPPTTPPRGTKSKGLASPNKKIVIPKTPHRPSMDAFWNQDFVNDWNDQHSPRKLMLPPVTKSPSKASPKKDPKKETKKSFAARKHALAESFLLELDDKITQGKIAELAESTGGVKLVWTKTLNTTAGRASWRRETTRTTRKADGEQLSVTYKHHASIELAEKVIDDEHRLLNVMAHEFCHLANFMVSGITTNPHGREFKIWAAKCSSVFGDRGIEVTTKHSYDIDFKYVWECDECGTEFKRHSKSIDPKRHRCGSCKGLLKQTRPAPRGAAAGKAPSRYQTFVKEQMAIVRAENPGSPQKVVMKLIAEKWAKQEGGKAGGKAPSKLGIESVTEKLVDLSIEGQA